jgi:hypothetical protein
MADDDPGAVNDLLLANLILLAMSNPLQILHSMPQRNKTLQCLPGRTPEQVGNTAIMDG